MITISPGHWHVGTGAVGLRDEVIEARKVVNGVCYYLRAQNIQVHVVVDNRSSNQRENLLYLVREHNESNRKIDVSIHFNSIQHTTDVPIGVEVLYKYEKSRMLAAAISKAISEASGLKNRGPKYRNDLYFLNNVMEYGVIIEICFLNSSFDIQLYEKHFRDICHAIGEQLKIKLQSLK